ncbi:hypothetical protein Tco_0677060 [Tanacetum coccineum]|uniref:Uncharacterized protein n=1 Tax=Tanacetum coccineum TaxID=301880 RepID=A0ABQ5EYR7_9ASTR
MKMHQTLGLPPNNHIQMYSSEQLLSQISNSNLKKEAYDIWENRDGALPDQTEIWTYFIRFGTDEDVDIEEMDINWQIAMMHSNEEQTGHKIIKIMERRREDSLSNNKKLGSIEKNQIGYADNWMMVDELGRNN